MRKLFYLGFLLLSFFHAQAQENRGSLIPAKIIERTLMVGGSASGSYRRINVTGTNSEPISGSRQQFDLDAKIGYFFLHDVALGVRSSVLYNKESMDNQVPTHSTNIMVGPFARYYTNKGIFTEVSAAVGVNNRPNLAKTEMMEFKGGVGYAIFINPKVAIEPAILMSYYQETRPLEGNRKITEWGPTLNVGLQVYLFRERKFKLASL